MTDNRCDDFLNCLRDARVVPEERVSGFLSQVQFDDPRTLALAFVRAGLLTDWQAKFLLSGRSRLHVGNYILQDRMRRDELGDLFLAWHEPLHRRVELQILPESVSRQSSQNAAFIDSTSRITKLDHPRLAHLYDVDQERGRFFVVGEHVPGQAVTPEDVTSLSRVAAGRVLHDISSALCFLHQQGLGHGKLDSGAIYLDENEHGKIVGIATAILHRDLGFAPSPPMPQIQKSDRAAWTELARKLVVKHFGGNEFLTWRDLVEQFVDEPASIGEFARLVAQWLRQNDSTAGQADLALLADQESPPTNNKQTTTHPASEKPPTARTGKTSNQRGSNPAGRIYLFAMGLLVAVGFLGYFLWKNIGKRTGLAKTSESPFANSQKSDFDSPVTNSTSANRKPRTSKTKTSSGLDGRNESDSSQPSNAKPSDTKDLARENRTIEEGTASSTTAMKDAAIPASADQGAVKGSAESDTQRKVGAAPEVPDVSQSANRNEGAPGKKGEQEKDPFKIPNRDDPPNPSTVDSVVMKDQDPQASGASVLPGEPPFLGLPEVAGIGAPDKKDAQILGPVRLTDFKKLRLELVYKPETVARVRTHFMIEADADRATWMVTCKRRPEDSNSQPVGKFDVSDGQLRFEWDAAVDAKSSGAALINCVLRLSTDSGDSKLVILRQPLQISGLVLDPKSLAIEVPLELMSLPNEEAIRFEFGPFPQGTPWEGGLVENQLFERKFPAVILFRAVQAEQAFAVAVSREFKSKLEVNCQWVALGGERPRPLRHSEFVSILDGLETNYAQLVALSEKANLDAENAVTGTKTASRERAKKIEDQKDEAKRVNDLGNFYREKLDAIGSSELPLRIFYDCDGQQILLAKTPTADAVAIEPEKPERRKRDD